MMMMIMIIMMMTRMVFTGERLMRMTVCTALKSVSFSLKA